MNYVVHFDCIYDVPTTIIKKYEDQFGSAGNVKRDTLFHPIIEYNYSGKKQRDRVQSIINEVRPHSLVFRRFLPSLSLPFGAPWNLTLTVYMHCIP